MVTFLSGGTGTPKLIAGFKEVYENFSVIVNTAEDVWVSGNRICPDIDSVIYTLAGLIDEKRWWGIRGDTFKTHFRLKSLGMDEKMMVGDLDRATHIFRSEMLRKGLSLTDVTERICQSLGISQSVIPMTDDEVATKILTPCGEMHFQEFWVEKRGEPEVTGIRIENIEKARPSKKAVNAIRKSRSVIIGPSNPVTSIGPIIGLEGIRNELEKKKVVVVSPFIGNKPFSGPAGKFMIALGLSPSPRSLLEYYGKIIDVLIVHNGDSFESDRCEIVETDIIIKSRKDAERLSRFILELL